MFCVLLTELLLRNAYELPEKVALAARLRQETTLTIKAIAARLQMGSRKSTTTRLQEHKRKAQDDRIMPLL